MSVMGTENTDDRVRSGDPFRHLDEAIERCPALGSIRASIGAAFVTLDRAAIEGNTIFLCGNGGSASDAEHFAAELLKGFERRRALPAVERGRLSERLGSALEQGIAAIPLTGFVSARTAIANDTDGRLEFAQLAYTLMRRGDVLVGISTSGNSENIVLAAQAARARRGSVIALVGADGGALATAADLAVRVPASRTLEVQELHLPVYHTLALMLESSLMGRAASS
jgi:D-sedoheptulose 7-phosphate isomerase